MKEWHGHLNGGAEVEAIFFDLQKAFDTVLHVKLITLSRTKNKSLLSLYKKHIFKA